MTSTRRVVALFLASILAACGSSDFVAPAGTTIALSAGNNQTISAAAQTGTPLQVLVQNSAGAPLAGVPVTWSVLGGGTVTASGASGADGIATATYHAGLAAGPKVITANINGASGSPVTFTVTVTPGVASRLVKSSGDGQTGTAGIPLAVPFKVQVVDSFGNGVAGHTVGWTVTTGSGTIVPTSITDAQGIASATLTPGSSPGNTTVAANAALTGSPITFTVAGTAGITLQHTLGFGGSYAHDMFVRGGIVFVSAWDQGLRIYDVGGGSKGGSPQNPQLIGNVVTNANGVSGGAQAHNAWWYWSPSGAKKYVFVGQEGPAVGGIGVGATGDIHVVDVTNMAAPVEVAYYHMSGLGAPRDSAGVHNFWVDEVNEILYAAYYNGGVVALNINGTLTGNLASREIARFRPGGVGNTYTWGVQLYNGSLYATDMLTGFWQLKLTGSTFSAQGGGANVPERYSSDQWVSNGYAYSGTWGFRSLPGNALKIWQLNGTGAPVLVDSIITPGVGTVSDVEVSADGRMLMFSAENGVVGTRGVYFYSLVGAGTRSKPVFIAHYPVGEGVHTATFAEMNGRRYVFAMRDPSAAMLILDVTPINP
jgi:hypothetical protein